ncbi:uncharacterized protein LOC119074095 [Bradysia coprophila]|uniref:uncharacterized protein LOC119074095 n=1 Tax=Bradysia coprophila TaxID=38358 RepID=UPI00187D9437|nr:uncharacterized protein LOC119074095 [Bradysia coprophila]
MAEIKKYFLESFLPSIQSTTTNVDISDLYDESAKWTPVPLTYSNKFESVMNLSAVIIKNLCKLFRATKKVPRLAFDVIAHIVNDSTDQPDILLRQILLCHVTKRQADAGYFVYIVTSIEDLKLKRVPLQDELEWVALAHKVIKHAQINHKINECLTDLGQSITEVTEFEKKDQIKITLVESGLKILRGFVGLEELFIHTDHFRQKINDFKGSLEQLQLVSKMDIISIAIHEYAHLKIRQSNGDFNMHSPVVGHLHGLPVIPHEFGTFTERKIFGKQIDWFASYRAMDYEFVERFVHSVENGGPLPPSYIESSGVVPRLGDPYVDGADIEVNNYIC